jgi:rod shape-determining protein MreD
MNRQRLSLWWFIGTLVFALLSDAGAAADVLEPFKPYWPALFLLYWALESGDRVTLGLAFALGCARICSNGVVLGEQALRLCALVFIALRFRSRLRFFPMWQQTLAVLALLLNDRFLLLIVRVLAGVAAAGQLVDFAVCRCGAVAVPVPAARRSARAFADSMNRARHDGAAGMTMKSSILQGHPRRSRAVPRRAVVGFVLILLGLVCW